MTIPQKPVLLIGGSGLVGRETATALRALHPDVPIAIGGRDLAKAKGVADALGHAQAVQVDLAAADLGLPPGFVPSVVVPFVKDETQNTLRFAQRHGAGHVGISSGTFEMAQELAEFMRAPHASAIVFASHWLVGAASVPALLFARDFARLDTIAVGVVLDAEDMGGPAADADFARLTAAAPNALVLEDGRWSWIAEARRARSFVAADGKTVEGLAYAPFDVTSLGAMTRARNARFDIVVGESSGRRRGKGLSTEIVIELEGADAAGKPKRARHVLEHPRGQAPVTALAVALLVERLLGLDGAPPPVPGLYSPDVLFEPERFLTQLRAGGMEVRSA